MKTISIGDLKSKLEKNENISLVDVRSPAEFRSEHIPAAQNIPLDQLSNESLQDLASENQDIYFVCQSGARSAKACQKVGSLGNGEPISVEGGTSGWKDAGHEVIRGKSAISIQRQVRIATGSLILIGCLIGYLTHPAGYILSGFIGAGLTFSGITDTCGMGLMLSRMPWNR